MAVDPVIDNSNLEDTPVLADGVTTPRRKPSLSPSETYPFPLDENGLPILTDVVSMESPAAAIAIMPLPRHVSSRRDVETVSFTDNSADRGTLASRISGLRRWFREDAKWMAVNVGAGVATAFAAKVALAALPVAAAAGAGIVASNLITAGIRSVKEAAQAEQKREIREGLEQTPFWKLFVKKAATHKISTKMYFKEAVSGMALSAASFGVIHNFSAISDFVSGLFDSGPVASAHAAQAAQSAAQSAVPAAHAVGAPGALDPIAKIDADIAAFEAGQADCPFDNQSWCDNPAEALAQQKAEAARLSQEFGRIAESANEAISLDPANAAHHNAVYAQATEGMQAASELAATPLSALDRAKELLGGDALSAKSKALVGAMIAHPDNAQLMKDAAQSLVKGHEDLAKQLYQKAIDAALEHGQKTAWAQASIDLAYLNHATAPAESLTQMQNVAANTKGTLHKIAQEFVDQWKGVSPTNLPPVDVVQNQLAEEAARKAAEAAAAEQAAQVATEQVVVPAADLPLSDVPASADVPFQDTLKSQSAELARAQAALTADYAHKEMVDYLTATGQAPAEGLSNLELAQMIEPENAQAILADLESNAPKLDSSQFAFSCAADIPTGPSADNSLNVHTDCNAYKNTVSDGDFGTVRDANRPNSLQYFFIKASGFCSAVSECVDKIVTRQLVPELYHSMR
ncbi:MAG: hypothetical protein RBR86_06350 [Pseudobdellovibrionaceae bacterium]|nr:hypothetical protein [Pseudobdellovibrionaceae bacterium]